MNFSSAQIRGMLLAGACGDALGAPVEFQSRSSILKEYNGPIRSFSPAYGKLGAITDDTQMLLWTAEGLLRADNARKMGSDEVTEAIVRRAYLRWYATQRGNISEEIEPADGWMWSLEDLHCSRAPGTTCLGGLGTSIREGRMGTLENPVHYGDGCGAIMRVAPVACFVRGNEAFDLGLRVGALSHGERGAVLASGFFAGFLSEIGRGISLETSLDLNTQRVKTVPGHEHIAQLVENARSLSIEDPGNPEKLESLGSAWRGDEALALTLYSVLSFPDDLESAVVFGVNHSGDADSTGSLVGNVMGLLYPDSIPKRWSEAVEMREEIEQVACDLANHYRPEVNDLERYPAR